MKKYDKYKDSGVKWIGEIPEHWEKMKFKYKTEYKKGKNPKKLNVKPSSNSQKYLAMDYLRETPKQIFYVNDPENYLLVDDNEILLLWDGSNAGEFVKSKKGILSSTMAILRYNNLYTDFIWFFSKAFEKKLKESTIGMGVPHVNGEELKNSIILIPPLQEQKTIASYLDEKTTDIDKLIENKQKLIDFYKEEKQIIINKAVTKGIDKNVKLKDSGIEWLGEIPEHWEVKKLRYLCKITTGEKDTENKEDSGEYPFYVRSQTVEKISTYSFDCEGILTAGDGVGVCKVWHYVNGKFDFHQRVYLMYDFQEVCGKFLFNYMKEMFINDVLRQSAKSTVDSLRRPMFLDFQVAYPMDLQEQQSIVNHIETECSRLDILIEKFEKQIELWKEYKTALISEVVTGKVKVV